MCGKITIELSGEICGLILLHMNNKGADQTAYPRSLISALVFRLLESILAFLYAKSIFQASLNS